MKSFSELVDQWAELRSGDANASAGYFLGALDEMMRHQRLRKLDILAALDRAVNRVEEIKQKVSTITGS